MERIKSLFASALIALVVLAGIGFGILAVGFAIVLGGAVALAMRLAGPGLTADVWKRDDRMRSEEAERTRPWPEPMGIIWAAAHSSSRGRG